MLGLDLEAILLLFIVISCADPAAARSKKKDLSRFTHQLDLVSVLQLSLRRNNDDYKDIPHPGNVPTTSHKPHTNARSGTESDTVIRSHTIEFARRYIEDENADINDSNTKVSKEKHPKPHYRKLKKANAKKSKSHTNVEENLSQDKSDGKISKPKFKKEIRIKLNKKKYKSHDAKSHKKVTESQKEVSEEAEIDQELTSVKDPWVEVINPETSIAPYLFRQKTTAQLKYKVLTMKRNRGPRRHGGGQRFLQTELNDAAGVVVAPLDVAGPLPDFKLPKGRTQYRADSDEENAEVNSAAIGDEDALVPR